MPEYPDIVIYIERLNALLSGHTLIGIRFANPFLLRTAEPPISSIQNQIILKFDRLGKRIIFNFSENYFLVLHLMISGRLHWRKAGCKLSPKIDLAAFDFDNGTLVLNEAGTQKRASLHLIKGRDQLSLFDSGGLEILNATLDEFRFQLLMENHTLKRSLTDPKFFSGIGNAYSDEILHRANLSPILHTQKLDSSQIERLFKATKEILEEWTSKFRNETGDGFPEKVTAFRKDMAVHGRYGKSCPICNTTIQRIRYANNETNYCPRCQTDGKILADRSLSRILKNDWPRSIEEMENIYRNK